MKTTITYNPKLKNMTGEEWIDYADSCGFSCMEIAVHQLPDAEDERKKIIRYARSKGFSLSLHAPFGKYNIIDTEEENRRDSVASVKASIDMAARYGMRSVTFHPGRLSDENELPEDKWDLLLKTVAEIAAYAKKKKVFVGLENMEKRKFEFVLTIADLNRFAEFGTDNPYFGVTIDFAHFSSNAIIKPDLSELKLPIVNVHLSQGIPGKMHFPLTKTDGLVDLESVSEVLKLYGYDGFVVLETGESYRDSKEIWENIYGK